MGGAEKNAQGFTGSNSYMLWSNIFATKYKKSVVCKCVHFEKKTEKVVGSFYQQRKITIDKPLGIGKFSPYKNES